MLVPDMALAMNEGECMGQNLGETRRSKTRGHLPLHGFIHHRSHADAAESLAVVQEVVGGLKIPGLSRRTALL
jgi:hypothetical protein